MKMKIVCIVLFCSVVGMAQAQDYKAAIGGRFGFYNGLTLKGFISSKGAIEGLLTTRWHGFSITGLYEHHMPIKEVKGLAWYVGGGAHIGYFDGHYYNDYFYPGKIDDKDYTVVGADLILGAEYKIPEIPLNVGLDWKPAFNFINDDHFWFDGIALSIRYIFKK